VASVEAALVRLDEIAAQEHDHVDQDVIDTMRGQFLARLARYHGRLYLLRSADSPELPVSPHYEAALRSGERRSMPSGRELLRWRDAGTLPDEGLRVLERELDHEERLLPDRPTRRPPPRSRCAW
jgi:monovalent cation/hydrogen antiporter